MINFRKISFFIILLSFFSFWSKSQTSYTIHDLEISLPSLSGDTMNLTSFQGKVILIDFWASWCGPCRSSNKQLVKLYEKYKDKGFEIFGVSLDQNKKQWEKAVKNDKIKWVQVNDNGGWESQTAMKWGLYYIPASYLLDKNGKLIARDPEAKDLQKILEDLLD